MVQSNLDPTESRALAGRTLPPISNQQELLAIATKPLVIFELLSFVQCMGLLFPGTPMSAQYLNGRVEVDFLIFH